MSKKYDCVLLDISIWELNKHPDNSGKYQLAISIRNGGSVTFGHQYATKAEAELFLKQIKDHCIMDFQEGFALMHLIVEKLRLKHEKF